MTPNTHGLGDLPHGPLPEDQAIPGVEEYLNELADVYPAPWPDQRDEQPPAVRPGPAGAEAEPSRLSSDSASDLPS
ncbi:hypothetical protein ACFV42_23135 [Streptomyces solisilvae]|uniref:hypothetical protein n=1 Tax=Streptomyces malaysiensis TaxID=92644 RepID=UPI00367A581D